MNKLFSGLLIATLAMGAVQSAKAQINAADSVMSHAGGHRLSAGGYGEAAYSRMFYSDNGNRYSKPGSYKNDPSHGQFDIPHAVIYLGYDFGKGWSMGSEIEFEHGGTGSSIENEADEAIEFENEQEKGGEVELEQFWLQKSFSRAINPRAGHIVVPFGLTNAHHEPLNFFTVYRPEGENTILPCTWHQTGVSLFGRIGKWSYNAENHIFTYRHYRIYQASFDTDNMGSYLSVNYDPWGITVTYIGYALLFLSLILMLILPGTPFRQLLQSPLLRKGLFVLTLLTLTPQTNADNSDVQVNAPIVNKEVAENFGRLFINYNGRICPVQTFALDFTQKIYGNHRYRRLTAEQVLLSWIFYAPEWGNKPFIHVKNELMREQLNLNEYSGLNAFFDADGYRLGPVVEEYNSGQHDSYHKACMDIDSKIQILMSLRTGSSLLMIPYKDNRDIKCCACTIWQCCHALLVSYSQVSSCL